MFQQLTIVGHVGAEPIMQYAHDGTPVTNFTVAVNRQWKDRDGETHLHTIWFHVTTWRTLAERCAQYLTTGRRILVVGEIEARAWLDREGNPRTNLDVTAHIVRFLDHQPPASQPQDEDNPRPGGIGNEASVQHLDRNESSHRTLHGYQVDHVSLVEAALNGRKKTVK